MMTMINLSNLVLDHAAHTAPLKGLIYMVFPWVLSIKDIMVGQEKAISKLLVKAAKKSKRKLNILIHVRIPRDNLTI
jgi:hypothetical protein